MQTNYKCLYVPISNGSPQVQSLRDSDRWSSNQVVIQHILQSGVMVARLCYEHGEKTVLQDGKADTLKSDIENAKVLGTITFDLKTYWKITGVFITDNNEIDLHLTPPN